MNRGRTEPFNDLWLKPLLDLAENYPSPEVQLAAMAAAARFPIGRRGWEKMIGPGWRLIMRLPPGSQLRRRTLKFAAGVPLISVREELCRMADDPDEPDREVIADALESVGDPSRIHDLLIRAGEGDPELWRRLAMAPLEHSGLDYRHIQEYARKLDADARFWLALAVGRLGNYARLDEAFAPGAPLPTLFWGSPWTAYERIAAIRPVPERLHRVLLDMLARLDETRVSQDYDLARALRDAAQEHEPTLPDRYLDVLERLLNQLESSALFSEESCSFSRTDMIAALVEWLARAQTWSDKITNPPTPTRD